MPDCFYVIIKGSALVLLPKDPEAIYKEKEKIRQRFKKMQNDAENKKKQMNDNNEEEPKEIQSATLPLKKLNSVYSPSRDSPTYKMTDSKLIPKTNRALKSLQKITKMMSFLNATSMGSLKQKLDQTNFLITPQMNNEVAALGIKLETLSNPRQYFDGQVFKFYVAATLSNGQSFGELGLLRRKPRAATILCTENTHLGILQKSDYETIYFDMQNQKLKNMINFFKNSLDEKLANDTITKFAYLFEKIKFSFGEKIYKEGDNGDSVFLIKKGEIELDHKKKGINQDKKENKKGKTLSSFLNTRYKNKFVTENSSRENTAVAILRAGDYFGEEEVFLNEKRKYNTVCISSTATIYSITKQVSFHLYINLSFYLFFRNFFKVLMNSKKSIRFLSPG